MFLPDLRGGGAEWVSVLLAGGFVSAGHEVVLILLRRRGELSVEVPEGVKTVDLAISFLPRAVFAIARALHDIKPDIALASMWPLTTIVLIGSKLATFKGKVLLVEHSALSHSESGRGRLRRLLGWSMRYVNSRADEVVAVSEGVLADLHALGLPKKKGRVIYNPVRNPTRARIPNLPVYRPWLETPLDKRLLAVGSLVPAKDFLTLLDSMAILKQKTAGFCLLILGNGPLKGVLSARHSKLELRDSVYFGNYEQDPFPFYRSAGVLVVSSAWEGFGNTIVEALSVGTSVVSTDCPSGPSEILGQGKFGLLVPVGDAKSLAQSIELTARRRRNPDRLVKRAKFFSIDKATRQYLEIMDESQ